MRSAGGWHGLNSRRRHKVARSKGTRIFHEDAKESTTAARRPKVLSMSLEHLDTPALLLSRPVLERNCARMAARAEALGVKLRPHLKTAKSGEVARIATHGQFGGITVSTLAEAAYFLGEGFTDMTYAVGMVPQKLAKIAALQASGARMTLLTDNPAGVPALSAAAQSMSGNPGFTLLIEIDSGGRRGGLPPVDDAVVALGRAIHDAPGLALGGVLVHAGHSYGCTTVAAIQQIAEEERAAAVAAAEALRGAGLPCPVVSVGSTPTAVHARHLTGVTEMRPGVYTLGDLMQVDLGSHGTDGLAVAVLATVIGHNRAAGRILIDAGGLALSKDLSAANRQGEVGYGLLAAPDGAGGFAPSDEGYYVAEVHQEHGLIAAPAGRDLPYDAFPLGRRVLVLPNHVCMTAAAHPGYHVLGPDQAPEAFWPRCTGW